MPPSSCMLAIILLTIFVEEGLTRRGGGGGGGRGGGRSSGASYGGGPGSYSGSGTSDGTTEVIFWSIFPGGVAVAFLLCLIVSCIRKYVCGKREADSTCKINCCSIFKTKDAYQRDGKPVIRRGIPLNYPKATKTESKHSSEIKANSITAPYAGETGSTIFSPIKKHSTNALYAGKIWSTNSSAIKIDSINAANAGNTGSTYFSEAETQSTVESISPPPSYRTVDNFPSPSYRTVDNFPPPPYSTIDEEILILSSTGIRN